MNRRPMTVRPIGVVRSPRLEPQYDGWGPVTARICLDEELFDLSAVAGIEEFSHLEVVFRFHLLAESAVVTGKSHPRGRTDLPAVGVLAQRIKERPNHLAVSRCELVAVEGLELHVRALDALDGTPVLDVKPFLRRFVPEAGETREPGWVEEVMSAYF
jgi:tRNA (adenine37-N6)-methyltransferase